MTPLKVKSSWSEVVEDVIRKIMLLDEAKVATAEVRLRKIRKVNLDGHDIYSYFSQRDKETMWKVGFGFVFALWLMFILKSLVVLHYVVR